MKGKGLRIDEGKCDGASKLDGNIDESMEDSKLGNKKGEYVGIPDCSIYVEDVEGS